VTFAGIVQYVGLDITGFKGEFMDWFLNEAFRSKDVASLCGVSIFKALLLITSSEV